MQFTIRGRVSSGGRGEPGLVVRAFDKDLLFDDLLGEATTDSQGVFQIVYEGALFKELFERRPDIYLKVLTRDRSRNILSTEKAVRFEAGVVEEFNLEISGGSAAEPGERTITLKYFYDTSGNIYSIEDEKVLKKKETVAVFNEAGEQFEIPANMADEFKLTPDEKAKVVTELQEKLRELAKSLSICPMIDPANHFSAGCPAIDPANLQSLLGTHVLPQQSALLAGLLRAVLGGGCPNVDPANLGSILGSIVNPAVNQLATAYQRILGGCPAIDPANLQSLFGTHVLPQQSALLAGLLRAVLGGGCPNIDPANLGSILGSIVNPAMNQLATAYQRILGGCPAIDPANLQSLFGTHVLPEQSALLAGLLRAVLGGGCPNVDPANLGSILGSIVNPAVNQLATAYQRILGGCPAIDPANLQSLFGTHVLPEQSALLAGLLRAVLGGGCPNVDPANLGSILGSIVNPAMNQLATAYQRILGGCPAIDPANLQSLFGTHVLPQQSALLAGLLRAVLGGGCPNIDPANLGSILGSIVNPAMNQLATAYQRILGGCPAIDPANLQSLFGTHVLPEQSALLAGLLRAVLGGGCPNVDPANLGSILGSIVNPAVNRLATAYQRILGGCPAIDPANLASLFGTISILQQLQQAQASRPEVSEQLKKKRKELVKRALVDLEFRELIKKDPKTAFGKEELSPEDLQSVALLDAVLPLVDDVIDNLAGNLLCT